MVNLVFVVGGAGAGKTTLAKRVAAARHAALFDMDTLLRPAAEALMTQAGLDPADRDSQAYKSLCRDLGYRITMDAALENVALGTDTIVIGPFSRELNDPGWLRSELDRTGLNPAAVRVKVVSVFLSDESRYRERIAGRGGTLDKWKLEHWERFSLSLGRKTVAWPMPSNAVLYVDNSTASPEFAAGRIERFIYGDTDETFADAAD
ncbi:ATP-binding protein [Cohnella ginsengisoli]|uniref:ATP-binding protein n=1 Tax=Cohnella ginsengisoli TaxID=425004 RepID=A0A9X4KEY1_9BACL|nr:AAA family ATPase [Cohnella ginsengisoli]MDG0790766.1 ATP-binding protein [Cohnella ginsengisoli]